MGIRLTMLLAAAMIAAAGLTASAWSLSQGQPDQAIAFGWPPLSIAILMALLVPSGQRSAPKA
ncbi:hypothetical protein [Maricaulis sp.]|uniref:hypothetical protein n=1 Tax=Maricaulis sp. TaxID=1486257 RepID=UPI00261D20EF|nr:hypothetical protein [Maricaulis sp.]